MKRLAIIGGGRMAGIFAENAKKLNFETHCFSPMDGITDKDAYDEIHSVNILHRDEVLEVCQTLNISGVVATTELTIAVAAYVADRMHLNGIPLEVAEVITDKYRNRLLTKDVEELSCPKFAKIKSYEELTKFDCKYPVILKPTSKGGKRGISVIHHKDDLKQAFEYAVQDSNGATEFIVEEFIDGGMECSVESLSYSGKNFVIQVTEKVTSGAPRCVELAHHQPANISGEIRAKVERVVDRILTRLNLRYGPAHTEIKIKDDNIYLIECNARPGGDHISYPLTQLSTGYPYIEGAIQIATDTFEGIAIDSLKKKCAGVLFVAEQTSYLLPIFETCENQPWFYRKNLVSEKLEPIIHNDGFNTNYFIYCDEQRPKLARNTNT